MRLTLVFLLLVFSCFTTHVSACGGTSSCRIADSRQYHIRLPDGHDGKRKLGAIFFAHGLGGSSAGIIKNQNLIRMANRLGVALVALQSKYSDWNIKNSPAGRSDRGSNEYSYLDNVIGDISRRFPIDTKRLMLAGVSVGGTMTWTMACTGRERFAAFMPISGTYWLSPPKSCSSRPANVIHVHGKADRTVPLAGRRVGTSAHSNVEDVIATYAKIGKYRKINSTKKTSLNCINRRNIKGKILDFCLHGGGHRFRVQDIEYAWEKFRSLGIL